MDWGSLADSSSQQSILLVIFSPAASGSALLQLGKERGSWPFSYLVANACKKLRLLWRKQAASETALYKLEAAKTLRARDIVLVPLNQSVSYGEIETVSQQPGTRLESFELGWSSIETF